MNKKFFTFNSIHNDTHDTFSPNLPCTAYTSFDTISPQSSPYHDTDSLSDKSKKIRKKRNTYQKIDDETRRKLLDAVQQGDTLKAAAKRYGINYSSAKSILHTYRKEGRITKKSAQERTSRRRTKTSQDLEMSPIYPYNNPQDEFDGVHEASTYQTYHSPEKSDRTHGLSDGGSPKAGVSGLPVNSFGGFLKIGYRHKSDNTNNRLPTPGIMVKLESQRSQTLPSADFGLNGAQSRNWQVNFNVQNPQEAYYYSEGSRNQVKAENVQKGCENYYINYASSPLAPVRQPKKEEQNVPKDYENFAETYTGMEDSQVPFNGQSYDVSCFLSSSPAYAFQQKMNGMNQYRNTENFSAMDSYRTAVETQEMYYDGAKNSYIGDFRSKIEEGAAGYITRAGLSSY